MIVTITSENFHNDIEKNTKPVIIKVYSTWCGPCQQMAPIFEELAKELAGKYVFAQMNVDETRELSMKFGISMIPALVFMDGGVVKGKKTGYRSKDDIKHDIEEIFG